MRFMVLSKPQRTRRRARSRTRSFSPTGQVQRRVGEGRRDARGEGLHRARRARAQFSGDKRTVIDGPFAETKS